jgi:hypothetical protein
VPVPNHASGYEHFSYQTPHRSLRTSNIDTLPRSEGLPAPLAAPEDHERRHRDTPGLAETVRRPQTRWSADNHYSEQRANVISSLAVAGKSCTVSCTGPSGIRHSVEVTADSLYEAAIVGINLLKQDGWVEAIAPGTRLEVRVRHPATTHSISVAQLRRWVDGIAVSPDETLKKRRLKALLPG